MQETPELPAEPGLGNNRRIEICGVSAVGHKKKNWDFSASKIRGRKLKCNAYTRTFWQERRSCLRLDRSHLFSKLVQRLPAWVCNIERGQVRARV